MIATCLHMLKGSPYIYQGEEIGMTNAYFKSISDYRDIEAINAYKEYTESGLMTEEEMLNCLKMISVTMPEHQCSGMTAQMQDLLRELPGSV